MSQAQASFLLSKVIIFRVGKDNEKFFCLFYSVSKCQITKLHRISTQRCQAEVCGVSSNTVELDTGASVPAAITYVCDFRPDNFPAAGGSQPPDHPAAFSNRMRKPLCDRTLETKCLNTKEE